MLLTRIASSPLRSLGSPPKPVNRKEAGSVPRRGSSRGSIHIPQPAGHLAGGGRLPKYLERHTLDVTIRHRDIGPAAMNRGATPIVSVTVIRPGINLSGVVLISGKRICQREIKEMRYGIGRDHCLGGPLPRNIPATSLCLVCRSYSRQWSVSLPCTKRSGRLCLRSPLAIAS